MAREFNQGKKFVVEIAFKGDPEVREVISIMQKGDNLDFGLKWWKGRQFYDDGSYVAMVNVEEIAFLRILSVTNVGPYNNTYNEKRYGDVEPDEMDNEIDASTEVEARKEIEETLEKLTKKGKKV